MEHFASVRVFVAYPNKLAFRQKLQTKPTAIHACIVHQRTQTCALLKRELAHPIIGGGQLTHVCTQTTHAHLLYRYTYGPLISRARPKCARATPRTVSHANSRDSANTTGLGQHKHTHTRWLVFRLPQRIRVPETTTTTDYTINQTQGYTRIV